MTKNYDEQVTLAHGGDTGEDNPESIQPIVKEKAWPGAAGRPDENNRVRTEILRRALETSNYFIDYDRALVLRSDAAFTFAQPATGFFTLALASGGNLWAYPALSPGRVSGGRDGGGKVFCENPSASGAWTPYAGTFGTDELTLIADRATTGQRGYADSDDYSVTAAGRAIGANRIEFNLVSDPAVAGGLANITAVIEGAPRTKITVTVGTLGSPTTLAHLITFINTDHSSQGTFGVADFLRASTTGSTSNPPVPFTGGLVQGAYDAEAHQITEAQLAAFFAATVGGVNVNRLREGEGLAIGYPLGPVERGVPSPRGGRRQSIYDLPTDRNGTFTSNITPSSGWTLFVTGREPEKIPGAIPIGKVLHGEFVFIDGTRLAPGETLSLGESRSMYEILRSVSSGSSGVRLIGSEGGQTWNADASATTSYTFPPETLHLALTRIVADLARGSTDESGVRRIGSEGTTGTASGGNTAFNLISNSLRHQFVQLLNYAGGLNERVLETGHRLTGLAPLRKEFAYAGMPAAGAMMLQSEFHAPADQMAVTPVGVQEYHSLNLQPLVYANSGDADETLTATNPGTFSTATTLLLSSMTSPQFAKVFAKMPVVLIEAGRSAPIIFVKITNLVGCVSATDGIYTLVAYNTGTKAVTLKKIDGSNPDFTSMSSTPNLTFCTGTAVANDWRFTRFHGFYRNDLVANGAGSAVAIIGLVGDDSRLQETWLPNGANGRIATRRYANRTEYASYLRSGGAWSSGTTYASGQTVTDVGIVYLSLQNANLNNTPASSPLWWSPTPRVTRSTNDILSPTDKPLLSGGETGTPVNANANHHHGGLYASFTRMDALIQTPQAISGLATTNPGTAKTVTPDDGFASVGVVLYYEFFVDPTAAGDTQITINFVEADGRPLAAVQCRYTASAGNDNRYFKGQVTLPLVGNQYFVTRDVAVNVELATSTYIFEPTAVSFTKL